MTSLTAASCTSSSSRGSAGQASLSLEIVSISFKEDALERGGGGGSTEGSVALSAHV